MVADIGKSVINELAESTEIMDKKVEMPSSTVRELSKIEAELKEYTQKPSSTTKQIFTEERQQLRARENVDVEPDLKRTTNRVRIRPSEAVKAHDLVTPTPRARVRGRPTRKQEIKEDSSSTRQLNRSRSSRRRQPDDAHPGPSVFTSETDHQPPTRTRTGRKASIKEEYLNDIEKVHSEIPQTKQDLHHEKSLSTSTQINEVTSRNTRRRGNSRFQTVESTTQSVKSRSSERSRSSHVSRGSKNRNAPAQTNFVRSRSRFSPPDIDEQKLEVLPLFETEPKVVNTIRGKTSVTPKASTERTSRKSVKFQSSVSSTSSTFAASATIPSSTTAAISTSASTITTTTTAKTTTTKTITSIPTTAKPTAAKTATVKITTKTPVNEVTEKSVKQSTRRGRKHQQQNSPKSVPQNSSRRGSRKPPTERHSRPTKITRRQAVPTPTETIKKSQHQTTLKSLEIEPTASDIPTKPKQIERRQTKITENRTNAETKKPLAIKETVKVSESEIISTKKISRPSLRRKVITNKIVIKTEKPKITISEVVRRGTKKGTSSPIKNPKTSLSSSEEDIGAEDNYPEAFKALLQEKKSKIHKVSWQKNNTFSLSPRNFTY